MKPVTMGSPQRADRLRAHVFVLGVAVACGVAGALGAVVFRALIHFVEAFAFSPQPLQLSVGAVLGDALAVENADVLAPGMDLAWWRRLIAPAIGGLLVGPIVHLLAREAKGHGVPAVMEAVAVRGGVIRPRVALVKTIASALTIGTGGSAGREGPIVQIGSAIGSAIGQVLQLPPRGMRTLVGCGAAAGIAATFNAPIAGALFAVEVILGDFATTQFVPIVVSSVVATVLSRAMLGDTPAFAVPSWSLASPWEIFAYAGLGLVAAVVGVWFGAAVWSTEKIFEKLRLPATAKAAVGGLIVGGIGVFLPQVFGSSYGSINASFAGQLSIGLMIVLLLAKVVATSITLGSGGSGGVFAPSLFLGAMTGGAFGSVMHAVLPASTASSGAYALVGMGAVVAAATHGPITAILLIFEMTQSIAIIPPLMTACVLATLAAMFLRRESIYTLSLVHKGLDVYAEKDPHVLRALRASDVVDRAPDVIRADADLGAVLDLLMNSAHDEIFVTDDGGRLCGAISIEPLRRLLDEEFALRGVVVAADLLEPNRPKVFEDDDLDSIAQLLRTAGISELAVVSREDPTRLVGSINERSVLEAYHREMLRRDLTGGLGTRLSLANRGHEVDLGDGYALMEIEAPASFYGRSLRELDLRGRHGLQVLLLRSRTPDGEAVRVPTADDCIAAGDKLVVAGTSEQLAKLDRKG